MKRNARILVLASSVLASLGLMTPSAWGQVAAERDGIWHTEYDDEAHRNVYTMEMTVYPAHEPLPALKYEFIPGPASRIRGNAAIYYLKAMGFFEQESARDWVRRYRREQVERLRQRGESDVRGAPPYSWLEQRPGEVPLEEAREYLSHLQFQVPYLKEAAVRDKFDMDRQIGRVSDLYGYLLPEIQVMRELVRTQSLRFRVAVAEDRIEDAIEILGQQFALARHLGQDDFLVTSLVGVAAAQIAWQDALLLVQEPDAPSLYWAVARLPKPLVSITRAMDNERHFVFRQWKPLNEVDAEAKPAEHWRDVIQQIWSAAELSGGDGFRPRVPADRPDLKNAATAAFVMAAYPGARKYLVDQWKMSAERLDHYPTAQIVALATVRFYEQWRDEYFKWFGLPRIEVQSRADYRSIDGRFRRAAKEIGPASMLASLLLPALDAVQTASARSDDGMNMLAAVEAIRLFAGKHGELPRTLDELDVPAHVVVGSNGPLEYRREGDRAILWGNRFPGLRYRLVIKLGTREDS